METTIFNAVTLTRSDLARFLKIEEAGIEALIVAGMPSVRVGTFERFGPEAVRWLANAGAELVIAETATEIAAEIATTA